MSIVLTPKIASVIISGTFSQTGEYPWQAAVLKKDEYDNVYVCGAALIGKKNKMEKNEYKFNYKYDNGYVCGAALISKTNTMDTNRNRKKQYLHW